MENTKDWTSLAKYFKWTRECRVDLESASDCLHYWWKRINKDGSPRGIAEDKLEEWFKSPDGFSYLCQELPKTILGDIKLEYSDDWSVEGNGSIKGWSITLGEFTNKIIYDTVEEALAITAFIICVEV